MQNSGEFRLDINRWKDNPWDSFEQFYQKGTDTEGVINRIIEKGVIVELPLGVDAFVPVSHLTTAQLKNIGEKFKNGDKLPLRVIEFDKENKKIVLSVVEYLKDKEQKVIDDYVGKFKLPKMTMKDIATVEGKPIELAPENAEMSKSRRRNSLFKQENLLSIYLVVKTYSFWG